MLRLPDIMVAPNGARLTKAEHPAIPVTIPEIVACAVACRKAGAGGIHAHVRDDQQQHVLDAGLYSELLAELAVATPGFFVQITTEAVGRYTSEQQRALVRKVRPQAVSIALREMANGEDDATLRRFYHECAEAGMAVQHILYDSDDIGNLIDMRARGIIPAGGLQALYVLGRYTVGQQSDPTELDRPIAKLTGAFGQGVDALDWGVCAFGKAETDCLVAAKRLGGKARIGFENNRLNDDGGIAADNAERVAALVAAFQGMNAALRP